MVFFLLSLDKLASQSNTFTGPSEFTHEAGKAVDGIYLPNRLHELTSIAVTKSLLNPWWRVDLGEVHCVWAVNILNRAG